jgi:hypothetical protein
MSVIDNKHNVVAYTSSVTKAFAGQRLATVTYKVDKVSGIKPASVAVSIPQIAPMDVQSKMVDFIPHIVALCERTQDNIIRGLHEAGRTVVDTEEIDVDSILAYLNAESTGGRLSKVAVIAWFNENLADSLMMAIAEKMGVSSPSNEEAEVIEAKIAIFRDKISSLTAGNVSYDAQTCTVLQKALGFAPAGDMIASRFIARLDTMQKKVPVSMIDAL